MRRLYHQPFDPLSRKIRLLLAEKKLECTCVVEPVWERRETFLALNPAGEVPVLVEPEGRPIWDDVAICEYLEEVYPLVNLLGTNADQRAEVRRLIAWFDKKFAAEVSKNLVGEKISKRFIAGATPNSSAIRAGKQNVHYHLDYIGYLTEQRNWLAGTELSLADITAAAHISCVDYLGDIPWKDHPGAHDWYARFKSRPCMRDILQDSVSGVQAARHYADLDF
ncbi:Glutathione S-transferase [Candidatus Terasakiella magnetica]|uniref:Glutathione S-transferase n=1 Tax=Candidatus Terasakiella magnetica TaxID=1867952 RepID=A0A1C3RIR3_9PROT|nr:glutathione S-transferase family protein [Candidatus Terasakiella magnetica]SCA57156.1 Glutathione S-transferase [Candidatus Terasakiella magnetica]